MTSKLQQALCFCELHITFTEGNLFFNLEMLRTLAKVKMHKPGHPSLQ